ncbi:hypothetical protein HU200_031204 [Digitaria exilis]|uniref:Uncharacterized protein n=1 Tax=Digitaria exilis TaxID=1010633 RepID=A0A835BZ39_9POAL|nr:hypothetical protein HU200_031204 [Digitaria exilis]
MVLVVPSSPDAARELMKTHDVNSRPPRPIVPSCSPASGIRRSAAVDAMLFMTWDRFGRREEFLENNVEGHYDTPEAGGKPGARTGGMALTRGWTRETHARGDTERQRVGKNAERRMRRRAATPPSSSSATMKLLVHVTPERVILAEADKDVVDFIFGLLAMPFGAAVGLLRADGAAADVLGCVANVYTSAEKMDAAGSADARHALISSPVSSAQLIAASASAAATAARYNRASSLTSMSSTRRYLTGGQETYPLYPLPESATWPESDGLLPPPVHSCHVCHEMGSPQGKLGFVDAVASYTVMDDDLTITPASNMSTVALLAKLGVKDVADLEERTVTIGRKDSSPSRPTPSVHPVILFLFLVPRLVKHGDRPAFDCRNPTGAEEACGGQEDHEHLHGKPHYRCPDGPGPMGGLQPGPKKPGTSPTRPKGDNVVPGLGRPFGPQCRPEARPDFV